MNKISDRHLFLAIVIAAISIITVIGAIFINVIPINGGKGWDGNVYFLLCEIWSNGESRGGPIPYQLTKMGSFLHVLTVLYLTHNAELAFKVAQVIAPILTGLAAILVALTVVRLNLINGISSAIGSAVILISAFATHSWLTMSHFYPLLTDHMALFLSACSFYIWSGGNERGRLPLGAFLLLFISLFSCFIMPALCLVPMTLIIFPRDTPNSLSDKSKVITYFAVIFSFVIVAFLWRSAMQMPVAILNAGLSSVEPPKETLKLYSSIVTYTLVFAILSAFLNFGLRSISQIKISSVLLCLIGPVLGILTIFYFGNFIRGFGGPPLYENLIIQSLRSPGASIAAVFAAFGPVALIAVFSIISVQFYKKVEIPNQILLISSFFMIFLVWGNESRQFICILPPITLLVIFVFRTKIVASFVTMVFSLFTLLIGHPISDSILLGISRSAAFSDQTWQSYFGRQGPWMSDDSIALYLGLATFYSIFIMAIFLQPHEKE